MKPEPRLIRYVCYYQLSQVQNLPESTFNSRVEFSIEKSEGCCIYRHAGIDYIALWDSLLPLQEVFATYLGTYF